MVILTSDTLTVSLETMVETSNCTSVRTLNFANEGGLDWRNNHKIAGKYEWSVSYWNNTSDDVKDPNFFDYWTEPSQQFLQVVDMSVYMNTSLQDKRLQAMICGV